MIGAGSSGIAVVKALADRGIPFDCFEISDRVGGNWAFRNPNGRSAAYRSLHINTSRDRMAYADLPMPRDYPDFPHHTLVARYFDDYVDHFGLRERITFGTEVTHATRLAPRRWRVTLGTGTVHEYGVLVVANGHHWDPRWPDPPIPGSFAGSVLHAHSYVDRASPWTCAASGSWWSGWATARWTSPASCASPGSRRGSTSRPGAAPGSCRTICSAGPWTSSG